MCPPRSQITLTLRGLPPYRSMWQPYKVWCRDAGRLVWTTKQVSSFDMVVATQQLAEFLAYIAASGKVGSAGTLCNYRSAINTAFMTVFNCQSLAESARVARAVRGFKSTNPSQPRWGDEETWDPGLLIGPTNLTTISSPLLNWLGSHGACLLLHAGPDALMEPEW